MEHIYTIKVKRHLDPRGLYPSERRYSASTVLGLACLHLALAATAALMTGLALQGDPLDVVPVAGGLLSLGALAAGLTALLASRKWYVDRNIMWFFLCSLLATLLSLMALAATTFRVVTTEEGNGSFCDYFSKGELFGAPEVEESSQGGKVFVVRIPEDMVKEGGAVTGTEGKVRRVVTVNILIAAAVEVLWSLLSLKIAWRGMRTDYPDEDPSEGAPRRGPTVRVVTEIKGNNTERLPKNTKILPPQPDLIEHYPKNDKIKKFFESQRENGGIFLGSQESGRGRIAVVQGGRSELPGRESSTEYRERMFNFLNAEAEGNAGPVSVEVDYREADRSCEAVTMDRISVASWGDIRDYPVYDQNTLDLGKAMLNKVVDRIKCDISVTSPDSENNSLPKCTLQDETKEDKDVSK